MNVLEVPEVIEGLRNRLWYHLQTRESLLSASIAFKAYYRLTTHTTGRPDYPEPITWSLIEDWLSVDPKTVPLISTQKVTA